MVSRSRSGAVLALALAAAGLLIAAGPSFASPPTSRAKPLWAVGPPRAQGLLAAARAAAASPTPTAAGLVLIGASGALALVAGGALAGSTRKAGSASARQGQPVSLRAFDVQNQPGVQAHPGRRIKTFSWRSTKPYAVAPFGFWDPVGFQDGTEETFVKYRTAEIKHGRVAMMAMWGLIYQHSNALPGFTPASGLKALEDPLAGQGLAFVLLLTGFHELKIFKDGTPGQEQPGDFGNPLGWTIGEDDQSPTYPPRARNGELANGRLAMVGFVGVIVAEANTGLDCIDQWAAATARWGTMGGFENF